MQTIHCQLCRQHQWSIVTEVEFGLWSEHAGELARDSQSYAIGECLHCHHVQMLHQYDQSLFSKLYFHAQQEAVMWHEDLRDSLLPYQQMIDFFQQYLPEQAVIADFGCGTGALLNAIQQSEVSTSALIGIDFNNRCNTQQMTYLSADLNDLTKLPTDLWPQGIHLATASHVLEHLIDPVSFLDEIGKHLAENGLIFLEVPDFSEPLTYDISGLSNLVNLQHIHYFTADSLTALAASCGYQLLAIQQLLTGYIPRLQVVLQKSTVALEPSPIVNNAAEAVRQNVQSGVLKRQQLAKQLQQHSDSGHKFGLWGIGADFYLLVRDNPEILQLCQQGKCQLFDYQLATKSCFGKPIGSSTEIPQFDYPVYLTPLLAETRIKMHQVAASWPATILDPFMISKVEAI
jgi:hypothetical protein